MAREYGGSLQNAAQYMSDRAPEVHDHTLLALSNLLSYIAAEHEESESPDPLLYQKACDVAFAWLLNQERNS